MRNQQLSKPHRVVFFSSLILVLEFVFFHVLQYTTDYLTATLTISFALLGLGLGGVVSSSIKQSEDRLFLLCILGCWPCLLLSSIKITFSPSLGLSGLVLTALFFFPGLYLAKMFSSFESPRVYLFDLWGAGLAVLLLTTAYLFLSSEFIILIILIWVSLVGLTAVRGMPHLQRIWATVAITFLIISSVLFICHYLFNSFDLFNLSKRNTHGPADKSFSKDLHLIKSYDNLISRVEILTLDNPHGFSVSFSGYINDGFHNFPIKAWKYPRLVTGLFKDPRVYILGAGAHGIVKFVKMTTVSQNIDGIEINPSIYRIMTKDFVKESASPYKGTGIKMGNGLADLQSNAKQYDIITMMNFHSTPRISYLGAPDFAHTKEFYKTIFDHLSPHGYLMIEERPWGLQGKYALYRQITTLYRTLKDMGYRRPEEHFFIYNFQIFPQVYMARQSAFESFFVGLLVQKSPLSADAIDKLKQWATHQTSMHSIDFLPDSKAGPYTELFTAIEKNRLKINYPGWDLSILTNDRPFPAAADSHTPELCDLLIKAGIATLLLLILVGGHSMRGHPYHLLNFKFLCFQACIGMAYMMVENTFMNVYQKEFISPSFAFIFTLAPLLIASAMGGRFLSKDNKPWTMAALTFTSLILQRSFIFFPDHCLSLDLRILLIILSVMISGFLMGYFFPRGLMCSKECGLGMNTGHYFAFNCIAGAFAIVFSYYSFVHFGFSLTIFLGALLYIVAAFLI